MEFPLSPSGDYIRASSEFIGCTGVFLPSRRSKPEPIVEPGMSARYFGPIVEILDTSLDRVHFDTRYICHRRICVANEFLGFVSTPTRSVNWRRPRSNPAFCIIGYLVLFQIRNNQCTVFGDSCGDLAGVFPFRRVACDYQRIGEATVPVAEHCSLRHFHSKGQNLGNAVNFDFVGRSSVRGREAGYAKHCGQYRIMAPIFKKTLFLDFICLLSPVD